MPFYDTAWPPNEPDSWPNLVEIMKLSGFPMEVTDTQRPLVQPADYHMYGMAADFARPMDDTGRAMMRDFAAWLYQYAEWFIEIIHTTPFKTDSGFYVKKGIRRSTGFYGAATEAAHANHVHVAISYRGSVELLALLRGTTSASKAAISRPREAAIATLFGYDGSDFTHVANFAGLSFVTHKITEAAPGQVFVHQQFDPVMAAARDQGIPFLGAYVVPRTGIDAGTASDAAIAELKRQSPWLLDHPGFFWQVDLEHWEYDKTAPSIGYALADQLKTKTGKPVVVYAPKWAYGDTLPSGYPLWSSEYAQSGASRPFQQMYAGNDGAGWGAYSGQTPAIWQYASDAKFADGQVGDANAFRGDEDDFRRVILGGSQSEELDDMYSTREIINAVTSGSIDEGFLDKVKEGEDVRPAGQYNLKALSEKLDALAEEVKATQTPEIDYAKLAAALVQAIAAK